MIIETSVAWVKIEQGTFLES
eukprot:SAG11_NODE_2071_length_3859_cov_2.770457_1_plen_20_part_10